MLGEGISLPVISAPGIWPSLAAVPTLGEGISPMELSGFVWFCVFVFMSLFLSVIFSYPFFGSCSGRSSAVQRALFASCYQVRARSSGDRHDLLDRKCRKGPKAHQLHTF